MGVRTLIGKYDGTTEAAVMVDSTSGFAFGPLFEGPDAPEQIDAFGEWLRRVGYSGVTEAVGTKVRDFPERYGLVDGVGDDPREWPAGSLGKLVAYFLKNVWEVAPVS